MLSLKKAFIFAATVSIAVNYAKAQVLTDEELELFEKYGDLFKKYSESENYRKRREGSGPVIQTQDGNVVVQVDNDKQMIIKVGDDDPVDIAGIPSVVRNYSDDTLKSFGLGFQTARANDHTQDLLKYFNRTFMDNERVAKEELVELSKNLQSSVTAALSTTAEQLNAKMALNSQLVADEISRMKVQNDEFQSKINSRLDVLSSNGDGKTELNAATSCKAIKDKFQNSADGVYYIKNNVRSGVLGYYTQSYLKVFCSFSDGYTYNETKGNLFVIPYYDGQTEPYEFVTMKAQYDFTCYGAAGGRGFTENRQHGGYGGMARGYKSFPAGVTLYMYPGGRGGLGWRADDSTMDDVFDQRYHYGGWNGGGRGTRGGSGGGGATDIRLLRDDVRSKRMHQASLNSRILTAGGGGGCGYDDCGHRGGHGGDTTGEGQRGQYGGTQSQGGRNDCGHSYAYGQFGIGGNIQVSHSRNDGGGGGGGWYGGSASCTSNNPGAGGSSRNVAMDGGKQMARGRNPGNGYVTYRWKDL